MTPPWVHPRLSADSPAEHDGHKAIDINDLDRITVIGVGLLGGSAGLALRASRPEIVRVGLGRRRSALQRALRHDAVDEITLSYTRGLRGTRAVILATPISHFASILEQIAPHLEPGTVVTDVGSTKAEVVRLAERTLPKHAHFVGSHPVAGSEKTGVEYARADLFDGAACFVTPTRRSQPDAVELVTELWTSFGSRVMRLSPARHDQVLARVSHLPHAVASVLIAMNHDLLDAAGTGLMDTTRIASGDPQLWRDIFASNRTETIRAIDQFEKRIRQFRHILAREDDAGVEKLLAASKRGRDAWIAGKLARKEMPS